MADLNYDQPPTIDHETQKEIDGMIAAISQNPQLGPMMTGHFRHWQKGRIVAPWTVADRMWAAYCEGVAMGVKSAVTAMVLAQVEFEKQEEGKEIEHDKEEATQE